MADDVELNSGPVVISAKQHTQKVFSGGNPLDIIVLPNNMNIM